MEEILASIRRIIADDDTVPAAPAPAAAPSEAAEPPPPPPEEPAPPPPEPEPEQPPEEVEWPAAAIAPEPEPAPEPAAEVLNLTEDMTALNEAPGFRTIDSEPDVVFAEPEPEPEPAPEPELQESAPEPAPLPMGDDRLLSGSATAAVDSAFSSLAQTVLLNNARTLEDLVREMLRPMLKDWLDDNLPVLVEKLVREEIERNHEAYMEKGRLALSSEVKALLKPQR